MANNVRAIRESKKLTLKDIALEVGCSIAFLADVELGRRGAKRDTWQRIADALGVSVEELKGDDNEVSHDPASG